MFIFIFYLIFLNIPHTILELQIGQIFIDIRYLYVRYPSTNTGTVRFKIAFLAKKNSFLII